jgi:hypothetical protein
MKEARQIYIIPRLFLKWAVRCLVCVGLSFPSFADVRYTPRSGATAAVITLSGQIDPKDLKPFMTFAQLAREDGFYAVNLDSIGGDVETALSMGRILRSDRAAAEVRNDGKCFSSCVFVLAAGVNRYVRGPVGIHRPYAPIDNLVTAGSQKERYQRLENEVKAYLRSMNIPLDCTIT